MLWWSAGLLSAYHSTCCSPAGLTMRSVSTHQWCWLTFLRTMVGCAPLVMPRWAESTAVAHAHVCISRARIVLISAVRTPANCSVTGSRDAAHAHAL